MSVTMISVMILTETILLDSGVLQYEFTRKAVKNINLRIKHDGTVHVSAPRTVTKCEAEAFIRQKEAFIRAAQAKFAAMPSVCREPKLFSDGTIIPILGEPKTVRILTAALHESVEISGDRLLIAMRPNAKKEHARYLLESYIRNRFVEQIVEICRKEFPRFAAVESDLVFPKITVRRMTSRYGSCNASKRAVTFNTLLYLCPPELTEYVVCHEFTHFFVQNHSADFYACFARFMPDWNERKKALTAFALENGIFELFDK